MTRVRVAGFAAVTALAMLAGALLGGVLSTADAQANERSTTLGAVMKVRQDAERDAKQAIERAKNTIVAGGCEFELDPSITAESLRRPDMASSGYYWVNTDCIRAAFPSSAVKEQRCPTVFPGGRQNGRFGSVLVTADCEIPEPERVELPQAIECDTRTACKVEVTFVGEGRSPVTRTLTISLD